MKKRKIKDATFKKIVLFKIFLVEHRRLLLILIVVLSLAFIAVFAIKKYKPSATIVFDKESGFYEENIEVELFANDVNFAIGSIKYTLNGDDPNVSGNDYNGKIRLQRPESGHKLYVITAAYCALNKCSKSSTRAYILGDNSDIDMDILSITSYHYGLYDYTWGIMVPGAIYDESMKRGLKETCVLGNYKMRGAAWERSAHMSLFSNKGTEIDQDIKLSVAGNASACSDNKSFKFTALDGEKLAITFEDGGGLLVPEKYKVLSSRIGSVGPNNIRTGVASRLLVESGFDGYFDARPVAIYLNGEFYAIEYLYQKYTDGFIAKRYGLKSSEDIEMVKMTEEQTMDKTGLRRYFEADLNEESNRRELEALVDMDDFLMYYAINVLWNNTDWPQNNYEIWRYNGDSIKSNKYTDGRWRFLSFDLDMIYETDLFSLKCDGDIFNYLMGNSPEVRKTVFTNVIRSEYYKEKFLKIIKSLNDGVFGTDNILRIVSEEADKLDKSVKSLYDVNKYKEFLDNVEEIKTAVKKRSLELDEDFRKYLGVI